MKVSANKPYDFLTGNVKSAFNLADYSLFIIASEYEDLGEDVPIYMRLPRDKYVRVGGNIPRKIEPNVRCFVVIAR
jgi:hypothetical protein